MMEVVSNIILNLQTPAYSTVYAVQGDTRARKVRAQLMDGSAPWEVPDGATVVIRYKKPDGTIGFYDTDELGNAAYEVDGAYVTFTLAAQAITAAGTVYMQLDFYSANDEHLSSFTLALDVSAAVVADGEIASGDYINALTRSAAQIAQDMRIYYGAPRMAAASTDMTDHDFVYVYTGTTTSSLTNGHWYSWNGTAWEDGGVYNSQGLPPDVAALPDEVSDLKSAVEDGEKIPFPYKLSSGYINKSTGLVNSSSLYSYTDYIALDNVIYIAYKKAMSTGSNPTGGLAFYNSSKTYISGVSLGTDAEAPGYATELETLKVPDGAYYVRFTCLQDTATYGDPEFYQVLTAGDYITMQTICGKTEYGSAPYGELGNPQDYNFSRSEMIYEVSPGAVVVIKMPADEFSGLDMLYVIEYGSDVTFLRRTQYYTPNGLLFNPLRIVVPDDCRYIKIATHTAANAPHLETFTLSSNKPIIERYNPNIESSSIPGSLSFCYAVTDHAKTSGRLMLPPNYTVDGRPVPLIVYAHGSGGMASWSDPITDNSRKMELFQYLNNEGFAVFDCYPWTDRKSFTVVGSYGTYSPVALPVNIQSYLKGIEYVCSRFNIDGGAVSLMCKSQGGHLGHWAISQSIFPFKAVCLLAPDILVGRTNLFYNQNTRAAMVAYCDFDGTAEEKTAFVESGDASNATVRSFLDKNKAKFVNLLPYAQGVVNGSLDEFYTDMLTAGTNVIPQWMQDLGFPSTVPYSGAGVPAFASHGDYVKKATAPSKFWCAFDDTAVSAYGNWACYYWLCNGGADTRFREMTPGTGGHFSVDTADNAETTSGTTALGITYTDIASAYVESVAFIRECFGD